MNPAIKTSGVFSFKVFQLNTNKKIFNAESKISDQVLT